MDDLNLAGIAHFNAGRFEEALSSFRAAVAAGRGVAQARVFIGHVSASQGRRAEAIAAFSAVIKDFPRHLPAYDGLANILLVQSPLRDPAAEKSLLGILGVKASDDRFRERLAETLRACGQALKSVGELEAAEKALSKALLMSRKDRSARRRLIEVLSRRAEACLAAGEPKKAERELRKILEHDPENAAARRALIQLLRRRGLTGVAQGRFAAAEAALRSALALAPRDKSSRRQEAAVKGLRGRIAAARQKDALLKKTDRIRRLRGRSGALVTQGRLSLAEAALRRALILGPGDPGAKRQLAALIRMRRRFEEKGKKEARRKKTARIRRLRDRGGELVTQGRLTLAEKALRRALHAGPGDTGTKKQLAEVLLMREQAESSRLQALRVAKSEKIRALLEALKASGQAYSREERPRLALKTLAQIQRLDPGEARALLIAGGVLYSAGEVARGRALIVRALRRDRGVLAPCDRFTALMKLGRYKDGLKAAERILDGAPSLDELRAFRDPWELDDRPLEIRQRELILLDRALGDPTRSPWSPFYRADLRGPEEQNHFRALAAFPKNRYGWMLSKAGLASLCTGSFREAAAQLRAALSYKTHDWRTRGFLAEALLCLGRSEQAFAQMDRAQREAPKDEAGQVIAWRGAFDLWLGRYDSAVTRFDEALSKDAPYALSWRAAALLKLGRPAEALEQLDLALKLYPRDLEAYVWRGEANRVLGRYPEALKDLGEPALVNTSGATPIWLWALVNRALVKAASGDRAGLEADFALVPPYVRAYITRKTGRTEPEEVLRSALDLSRGYRREEYRQAIWMT